MTSLTFPSPSNLLIPRIWPCISLAAHPIGKNYLSTQPCTQLELVSEAIPLMSLYFGQCAYRLLAQAQIALDASNK